MLDITSPSTTVKSQTSDGLSCDNPSELKVRLGQEAMARQRRRWEDWILIAEALDFGRAEVMRDQHTNQPAGRRYEKAMGEWLVTNGFKEIDKAARCRLLECLQQRNEIEKWRALLTDGERFRFNHPGAVLRRWKAAAVVPDPNATPKPSPFAQLKEAHVQLIEKHHRLEREIETGGGDLWTPQDTADDIANVIVCKLPTHKAERVARAMLAKLKERQTSEKIAKKPEGAMP